MDSGSNSQAQLIAVIVACNGVSNLQHLHARVSSCTTVVVLESAVAAPLSCASFPTCGRCSCEPQREERRVKQVLLFWHCSNGKQM
jgi:hypothetical protein